MKSGSSDASAALVPLHRDALTQAQQAYDEARLPYNFPVNFCFSPDGTGLMADTVKGKSRTSARSFFIHHTQRIALAAVLFDARALRRAVQDRRSALMAAARPEGADRTSGGSGLAAA